MFPDLSRDDVFTLETARLWLRWPRVADAAAVQRLAGEKVVAEMTANIPHPYPDGAAETFIFNARKANALGDALSLAIALKGKPNALIGMIAAQPNDSGALELGFWLAEPLWGEGYMTEAARSIIDTVFTLTDVREIVSAVRVINPASRRVQEKCGFRHEGSALRSAPARGGAFACDLFRLDRRTWEGLKAWGAYGLPIMGLKPPALFHREMEAAG
ncbi:MAG: GNAT family N-acetyltransferase [Rhizobiales bacterium 65-9]|nr:GNAT family N-acetyltransferase [Hyphomicrobiales bacterium]OJY37364.1 MAG: GNAT family N-acetyltransferase [Rhizobiales bacterium 65-9]